MIARIVVLALAVTGCLHDSLVPCGDLLCPATASCVAGRCVAAGAVAECADRSDGTSCATEGLPAGVCSGGICITRGCGNGVIDPGEACDDGNTVGGDGCSANCDAIDTCPPIGVTPSYAAALQPVAAQSCQDYSASSDLAIALCVLDSREAAVEQSASGSTFAPIANLTSDASVDFVSPRLAPEGDELFVVETATATDVTSVWAYAPVGDGTWTASYQVAMPYTLDFTTVIGAPSRGPNRHMMVWSTGFGTAYEVAIDAQGTGTDLGATLDSTWDGEIDGAPNLSPDGLRAIGLAVGAPSLVAIYTDRKSLDAPFRAAEPVVDVPATTDGFMTPNCDRVYFGGFGSVFYVLQN